MLLPIKNTNQNSKMNDFTSHLINATAIINSRIYQ